MALLIGNEPAFLELFFAIVTLGWVAIPFDPKWSAQEAIRINDNAQPDLMITSKQFINVAQYHFTSTIAIEEIKKTVNDHQEIHSAKLNKEPFYLGFTSGSTGIPKGFIRNHESWLTSFTAGEMAFQYDQDDIMMAPGPLSHSLSLYGAVHALHIGATFYLTTSFSAVTTFDLLKAGKATVIYAVPTMLNGLAGQLSTVKRNITILSSGAKLETTIKNNLKKVFPTSNIYEYYGASELSFITYTTEKISEMYPNSVGKPFPGVRISIRHDAGDSLPNNEIGNIYIESNFLFTSYVNNPQATKEVLTKYGANIGDLGFMNDEGVLTIVGREKNMMISGGQNVYPEEVELVIKQSNYVKDVIVLGINDPHWGQKIIAFIQWKNENLANIKQLRNHCKTYLSIYKRPRKYYTVKEFPYTQTGKIARNEIETNMTRWIR